MRPPFDFKLELEKYKAKVKQAEKQQGLGRQIISNEFKNRRFIAVGPELYHIKNTETFHDFLSRHYLPLILGHDWLRSEIEKGDDAHPIGLWRRTGYENLVSRQLGESHIQTAEMNGAMYGYLNLAYNLYLLGHNSEIQALLVKRLKNRISFEGAIYETFVAAMLIKAGFKIELEDEQDGSSTHGEFFAISQKTGKKFWVEAKARQSGKDHGAIGNQLYNALKKRTELTRVIFIELSLPSMYPKINEILNELKDKEQKLVIKDKPADPAYVFVTNHGYLYDLKGTKFESSSISYGFKMNSFNYCFGGTVRQIILARDENQDMYHLFKSMEKYRSIPSTFDGEIPEFAYNTEAQKQRLLIGNEYLIPTPDGEQIGKLTSASFIIEKKEVAGAYQLKNGKTYICYTPMTDEEVKSYLSHPDTFFGVSIHPGGEAKTELDMLDFFLNCYQDNSKESLLRLLGGDSNRAKMAKIELLIEYAEVFMRSLGTPIQTKK